MGGLQSVSPSSHVRREPMLEEFIHYRHHRSPRFVFPCSRMRMRMAVVSGEEDHFPTRTSPEYSHPAKRAFYAGLLGRRKQDSPLQLLMFKRASLVPVLSLIQVLWYGLFCGVPLHLGNLLCALTRIDTDAIGGEWREVVLCIPRIVDLLTVLMAPLAIRCGSFLGL